MNVFQHMTAQLMGKRAAFSRAEHRLNLICKISKRRESDQVDEEAWAKFVTTHLNFGR